ncbi:uncharacterized protein LOC128230452 [Mya arenaria]|nr:uncharacterized protein LOC128230452 [Mya arenaria]
MQLQSIDRTFAEIDIVEHQFQVRYGRGRSCRTQNDTSGYFSIDTTGTGLVVDPELEWRLFGWYPSMITFSRSADGRRISAWCGGYCGVCRADGGIKLKFNPHDEIVGDAMEPVCV